MEALRISMFPLFFLLQFFYVALADNYTVPDKYFINCGSDRSETQDVQVFVPDSSVCFSKHSSVAQEHNKSSTAGPLYRTARIFRGPSGYKFRIHENDGGYYVVRLHFYAFSSPDILSRARFNVSSAGFLLLDNFSAESLTNSPVVKEFYLKINSSRSFQIDFIPVDSSFAFVNAIELFRLPDNFIPSKALPHATSKGKSSDYKGILSSVLLKSYRLDVGGSELEEIDSLRRSWVKDDRYAKNGEPISRAVNIKYVGEENNNLDNSGGLFGLASTDVIAPDTIYQSARAMTSGSVNGDRSLNVSWDLQVKSNASYFIRAHFCDITTMSDGLTYFNFYIYNNFNWSVRPDYWRSSVPFYRDFVVDSDGSGNLRISVGPDEASIVKNAFLNGLEVMEIVKTPGQYEGIEYECKKQNHNPLPVPLEVGLGAFVLICIMLIGLCLILKCVKPEIITALDWAPLSVKGGGSSHGKGSNHGSSLGNLKLGLKMSFHEIQSATNNFHTKRIVGKGGFGNVYKGVLKNGVKVAVKRSKPGSSGQGFPEFQTEIMVLSRIRHRHLVSLIGYCDERSEMILVYEYMEKGTLRDHLYNSNLPSLTWKQRLEICIGAARGLNYLHKGAAGGIIHRDVKSTNILVDENNVAKVADFGLSKTGPLDQQPSVTTGVKGTFGYLDPEYFRTQQLTEKSDVYSFGVVLLEVLCARPALDPTLPWNQVNLAEWGMYCKQRGTLDQLIDPMIKDQIDQNSLRKFSETVEKCLQEDGCDRPTMGDVLWDLEYSLQLQRGARQRNSSSQEYSYSGTTASIELTNVRRLPSLSTPGDSDVMPILNDDSASHCFLSVVTN
ncbi:probable receptor-like protein kinase At2g23200 [Prosopis cineraria]|uniref:probable receptor-like protein kinase At2g23200 n=1 Tax=Prosopis cineraria TaxID=364024 RepID=UPI00240FD839|nr:probable receptor-like protein kinase At2g23200 [Prosopis cineraria]